MTVLRWIKQKPYEHRGEIILIPAWQVEDGLEIASTEALREFLDAGDYPSSWWQLKLQNGSRLFCHWCGAAERDRTFLRGLHVTETDPPMVAIGAGWVERVNGRYTGRVTDVNYALHADWCFYSGTTYQFLKELAEQFKKENE